MSENTTNKNVRDDEIDLLDLFRRMGKSLSNMGRTMGRAFLICLVFLIKRWLPLGISIILGVGCSYLVKQTSVSLYTSDLVLRTNTVNASELIPYLNRLHNFNKEKNKLFLKDAFHSTPEKINNLIDINAYWIIDQRNDQNPDFVDYSNSHDIYDTVNVRMLDRVDIRVKFKSPMELNTIRDGILNYIESDSLFQQRNRLRLKQKQEMLTRLNYDIIQLDSLQKLKVLQETRNLHPSNGGQMIFLQEQKTQLLYPDIQILYLQKQLLESEMALYKNLATVLSDFSLPTIRDNGGMYYGKKYIPLFFSITLLILILLANRKKLEEVYRKY